MRLLLIFILLSGAATLNAQTPACKKIRTGKFVTIAEPGYNSIFFYRIIE